MVERTCSVCKNKFFISNFESKRKGRGQFCGVACRRKKTQLEHQKLCRVCHIVFYPRSEKRNKNWAKFCSKSCAGRARKGLKTTGYDTPINKWLRGTFEYVQWRTTVFERDNYTCKQCRARNGIGKNVILNADHIFPLHAILKKNHIVTIQDAILCQDIWDINNGRTLCIDCHKKTDTWGSKTYVGII